MSEGLLKEHVSIIFDSRQRNSGTNEKPIFQLKSPITFANRSKHGKKYYLIIHNVLIPKSFYEINSTNNVFKITEEGGGTITITIDPGNYTISELLTELESELDSNTTNTNNYTLTYDDNTSKVIISFTGTSTDITINSIANGSTLNEPLGFGISDTQYITNQDSAINILAGVLTSASYVVDLNPTTTIEIESNISSNNYYFNDGIKSISAIIPMNVDRFAYKFFENHGGHKTLITNSTPLNRLEFILKDVKGNDIDLNGSHWSFSLVIYELTTST